MNTYVSSKSSRNGGRWSFIVLMYFTTFCFPTKNTKWDFCEQTKRARPLKVSPAFFCFETTAFTSELDTIYEWSFLVRRGWTSSRRTRQTSLIAIDSKPSSPSPVKCDALYCVLSIKKLAHLVFKSCLTSCGVAEILERLNDSRRSWILVRCACENDFLCWQHNEFWGSSPACNPAAP